jgi:hypothetical protein
MNIDFKYKYIKYKLKYLVQKANNFLLMNNENKLLYNNFKGGRSTEYVIYKSNITNKILHNDNLVKILDNLQENEIHKYNNNITYKKDKTKILETKKKKYSIEYDYFTRTTILFKDFLKYKLTKKKKPITILIKNICGENKIIDGIDWFNKEYIEKIKNSDIEELKFFIYNKQEYYLHIYNKNNIGYSYYLYIIVDKINKVIFLKLFFFDNTDILTNGQTKLVLSQKERNILWNLYYLHNIINDDTKTISLKEYHYDIVDILRLFGYLEENNKKLNTLLRKLFTGHCIPIKKKIKLKYEIIKKN